MYKISKSLTFILVTTLLLITACSKNTKQETQESSAIPALEIVSPVLDQPFYTISLPGELKPYEEVEIHAKVKGFIKKIYVDRGSFVKKGQLLAVLEAPEITQQFLSAKSNENKYNQEYLFAQQVYERLKNAAQTGGAVAEIELDRALSALNGAKAALEASNAQSGIPAQLASYLRIVAPFDGMIVDRKISEGALVGDNTKELFNLAQTNKLRLTIAIPEKYSQSVHEGMKINFTVNSIPGKSFEAELSRSASVIQKDGRALFTEFDVINNKGELNGGEYAQVQLELQRPDKTIWVPASSVIHTQSGNFVLKVDDQQKVQRIRITEGRRIDTLQEIFGMVNVEDKVIKNGSEELKENVVVNVSAPK